MTHEQIDQLEGDALDRAIAEAMEPMEKLPHAYSLEFSPDSWWRVAWSESSPVIYSWHPTRKLCGNVAIRLLEKLREWDWSATLIDDFQRWRAIGSGPRMKVIGVDGESMPIAVARLFLRVAEARKASCTAP